MQNTEIKIRSFENLPTGWNYGRGVQPSAATIARALLFSRLYLTAGFAKTDAFPGTDGEIMVTAYHGKHYVEVTCEIDGSNRFAYENGEDPEVYEEGLNTSQVVTHIAKASRGVRAVGWRSYELSIQSNISTQIVESSRTWHLDLNAIPMTFQEYPASMLNALSATAEVFAGILPGTMHPSAPSLPSSGYLTRTLSQLEAA